MKFLKIRHRRKTFGIRNSIEQWFSELKRRIRQFNVCFPNENLGSHPLLGGYRNVRFLFGAMDSIVGGLKLTVSLTKDKVFILSLQQCVAHARNQRESSFHSR